MDRAADTTLFGSSVERKTILRLEGGMPLKQVEKKSRSAEAVRLFTLREVAEYLKVHPVTVYRLVKSGQLPAARIGRDLRFDIRLVEQWVAEGGTGTARGRKSKR
jgi:excisionase family DNA binding protein